MTIKIFTTGGTFDKVYFDAKSEFRIGEPMMAALLEEANVSFDYDIVSLLKKDSLDMSETDRQMIHEAVCGVKETRIMITHGTDSMVDTARLLGDIKDKTIVIFGAMQPARMRYSDAMYNLGVASAAVQLLPPGIYLAMNGQIFDPHTTSKNRARSRFESIASSTSP